MNALLHPLRQIGRDLVQKKLWPLAVLLVVALVAVPVVIGSSSEDASAPVPVATAPGTADPGATQSLLTVADPAVTSKDDRPGKLDDPFYDPPAPPAASTGAATAPATGAAPSTATPSTGGAPAAPAGPAAPAEPVVKPTYYRTEVRWYEATKGKPQPISRLEPFGGLVDTAALYLGVTKSDGVYAVFLLGPGATSDGEAKCEDESCRVMGLKSGQTQIVTVQPADGGEARQYVLEVVSVRAIATDAADARHMRAKVHPDGRDVMRSMWEDGPTAEALRPVQYDQTTGLLVKSGTPDAAAVPKAVFKRSTAGAAE